MADALLSPAVGGTFWAGTLTAIIYSAKKLKEKMDEKMIPLMGVLGAFVFAAQMINFTIPGTGSSGHIGGGMLLAILLGPYATLLVIASVLTIQALFFADGGLLALGSNIWNLGIYPCFIGYPIYRAIVKNGKTPKRIIIASVLSVVVALELGAFSVILQTKLSNITELPFGTFLILMLPIHLAIGIVEGFITAGIVNYVRTLRPDIIPSPSGSVRKVVIAFAILTILTGGALSWFASAYPDGLEWSIEQIYGKPEIPERTDRITEQMSKIQEKTTILPDYTFPSEAEKEKIHTWPAMDTGTSVSGLFGGLMVLGLVVLIGLGIKAIRRYRERL
jgi:cobalt/nickel transport system permease protein